MARLSAAARSPFIAELRALSARRRWPACSEVIVMPCPKVGLKLATASPNGTIPRGKRSSLS
ncbi:Uncharacterised protein [Mycobacterium tuberculosis]|nr:Uncharacterised protein [Mycobacterium tuberculosis]